MMDGIWIAQLGGALVGIFGGLLGGWLATRPSSRLPESTSDIQWDNEAPWGQ